VAAKDEKKSNPPAPDTPPDKPPVEVVEKVEKVVTSKIVTLGSVKVTIKPDENILTWHEYPDKVVYYVEGPKTGQKVTVKK
jgi:hypothetical protein